MSIVAVISSPEKNGNTEVVVNAIVKSAQENGKDVKVFSLNGMANKKGCQACFACKSKGKCVQNDDLTPVLDAIREADSVILSAPVYFGDSCGQYRLLEDRFFSFIDGMFKPNIPTGKKLAIVTAAGSAGAAGLADKIETNMKNFFQFDCVGKIAFETGNKRDFAANNAEILAKAAELGKKL